MKTRVFSIFTLLLFVQVTLAQQTELVDVKSASSYSSKSYVYTQSVTLQPNFTISASQHGTFFIRPAEAAKVARNIPPSTDKNFVRKEEMLVGGITSLDQVGSLDVTQKSTNYQYMDGAGRPLQSIIYRGSPAQFDVVKPYAYDSQTGKMIYDYMGYASTGAGAQTGAFKDNAVANQATFYNGSTAKVLPDSRPFSEYSHEYSTLNRVKETFGPGELWKNNNKNVKGRERINVVGEVRRWTISSNLPTTSATYPPGTLLYTTATDEDGNISKTYVDMRGNPVMKDNNGLITYYIYDEMGRLRFVLPPELCNDYPSNVTTVNINQTQLNTWAFQYTYDVRGRLIQEKGPGPDNDWVYYVYDQWDRLVLKQDGVQRDKSPKEWSFTKYDELNRPIITGIIKSNADHSAMISAVTGGRYETENTSTIGYTLDSSFPTVTGAITSREVLTITYYDDYSFLGISGWSESNSAYNPDAGLSYMSTVKGEITGSKIKVLEQSNWLNSVTYYDKYYNPVQTIQKNHLTGVPDRITNIYNFAGWLTQTKRNHYNTSGNVVITEDYEYDHGGRLKNVYHQINSNPKVLLASYGYNEAGQLVEKNLHSTDGGGNFLQSVDYRYNIRGWLTSINNATLTNDGVKNDDANDLFGMELVYNQETINVNGTNTERKYNGTISAARWKANDQKTTPKERIYAYKYNSKNWLQEGRYAAKNGSAWTGEAGFYNLQGLTYDDNGNILTLDRYGKSGSSALKIDELTYGYGSNGNQLTTVVDATGSNFGFPNKTPGYTPTLEYDKNGNLEADLNEEITSVVYNYLNLPSSIDIDLPGTTNDYRLEFTYDATGYLLKRVIKQGGVVQKTIDYVQGIQYSGGQVAIIFTPEGRATKYNNTFEYEYFIKDHLTNTRTVFGYMHDTDVYKATMETYHSTKESTDFKNINSTRVTGYNTTVPNMDVPLPDMSSMVNGFGGGNPVGPAKMLQVKSGDRVQLEVYARYTTATSSNNVVTNLLAAVTGTFNIVNSGETQAAYQAFSNYLLVDAAQVPRSSNSPKAYLFYVLFNNSHGHVQFGYKEVNSSALLQHQKLELDITVPSDGYLYTYVVNESNVSAATAAYFDDFKITHHKTTQSLRVTEVTDYDPFGFLLEGTRYVDDSRLVNNYGYQGEFAEFESLIGWNRFAGRGNYDPRLGRWHSVDPKTQFASPYMAMGNNPVIMVDPDGQFAILPFLAATGKAMAIGAAVFGTANFAIQAFNGEINSFQQGLSAFASGAIAGAATTAAFSWGLGVPILGPIMKGAVAAYRVTTSVSLLSGIGQGFRHGDWTRLQNTAKIFFGNFYLDGNRSFGGQTLQGISRFTYELLQTTSGYGYSQIRNTLGLIDQVEYFGGATFSLQTFGNGAGNSMGNFINANILGAFNGVTNDPLLMHEYGHTFDSQIFGPLYLPIIGLSSARSAARSVPNPTTGGTTHDTHWTELRANRHARDYFAKFGVDWSIYEVPFSGLGFFPTTR